MAADPERAIEPADDGTLGRAGAKLGVALGTVGEAIDQSRSVVGSPPLNLKEFAAR